MVSIPLGSRVFAPNFWPTLLFLPVFMGLLSLGYWQWHRAEEKRALYEALAVGETATSPLPPVANAVRYAHVTVTGRFIDGRQILVDNMTHEGATGYRVWTPLETPQGDWVLVDRGWVPAGATRADLPVVDVGEAVRTVRGRLDEWPRPGVRLEAPRESGWPRRMSFPNDAALTEALGRAVYPKLLLLDAAEPDGYVRDWHPGGLTPERHLGYAFQWFALAATLLGLYVYSQCRIREDRR